MCTSAPPNAWCAVKPPQHRMQPTLTASNLRGVLPRVGDLLDGHLLQRGRWIFNCFGTVQDGPRMTTEMMGKWWANPLVVQICTNHLALPDPLDIFGHFWTPSYILNEEAWQQLIPPDQSTLQMNDETTQNWPSLTHRWPFTTELLSSFIPKCSYSTIGTLGQGSVWSTPDLCVWGRQDTKGRTMQNHKNHTGGFAAGFTLC